MRLALISDCYLPTSNGVARMVAVARDGLVARGHEVTLVVPRHPERTTPSRSAVTGSEVEVRSVPLFPSVGIRLPLVSPSALGRLLDDLDVEVVHTHTEGPLGRAARSAAVARAVPVVHTLHTHYEHYLHYLGPVRLAPRTATRVLRHGLRRFLAPVDRVIAPSRSMAAVAGALVPADRLVTVPNGVPPPPVDPARIAALRQRFGLTPTDRVLLSVGRVSAEKRSEQLVDALIAQLPTCDGVVAIIVGGGRSLTSLRARVAAAGLTHLIRLPGDLDHADVLALQHLATVYVTASRSENHPVSLLEAALAGRPLVTRRDARLDHLVVDGDSGVTVPDDRALVVAALALVAAPERAARLGAGARVRAAGGLHRHLAALEAVYAELRTATEVRRCP